MPDRREFFGCIGAYVLSNSIFGIMRRKRAELPRAPPAPEEILPEDFEILHKDNWERVSSLEDVLKAGSETMPNVNDLENISGCFDQYPELLFQYKFKKADGVYKKSSSAFGSSIIINRNGYFLCAYHSVEDIINQSTGLNQKNFVLMLNPETGSVAEPQLLIASKKYDVVMGRFPGLVSLNQRTIPITKANMTPYGTAIVVSYRHHHSFKKDLNHEELLPYIDCVGDFTFRNSGENNVIITYQQKENTVKDLLRDKELREKFSLHHEFIPTEIRDSSILEWLIKPPGAYPLQPVIEQGDSGSPVFDVYGSLIGIVTGGRKEKEVGYCVKPNVLRAIVRYYIDAVKNGN